MEQIFKDEQGREFKTDNPVYIRFIEDMEREGIPWRTYSGRFMYGKECPAVACGGRNGIYEEDVAAATAVRGFSRDQLGLGTIIYVRHGEIREENEEDGEEDEGES